MYTPSVIWNIIHPHFTGEWRSNQDHHAYILSLGLDAVDQMQELRRRSGLHGAAFGFQKSLVSGGDVVRLFPRRAYGKHGSRS